MYSEDYDLVMKLIGYGEAPKEIMERTSLDERLKQSEDFLRISGTAGASKAVQTVMAGKPWNEGLGANRAIQESESKVILKREARA